MPKSPTCGATFERHDIFLGVRIVNMIRESFAGVFVQDVRQALGAGNGTGLIYTRTVAEANELTNLLTENAIEARSFYGNGETLVNFNGWLNGDFPVLIATAESLRYGIAKRPLSFVFHFNPPEALKDYYQASFDKISSKYVLHN